MAGGHGPRDMWPTLPARRAERRGFTRRVTRMYLLSSDASRDSISPDFDGDMETTRVHVAVQSALGRRHGRALPEAAVAGTRV